MRKETALAAMVLVLFSALIVSPAEAADTVLVSAVVFCFVRIVMALTLWWFRELSV